MNNARGLSLVEVMIGVAIMGGIALAVNSLTQFSNKQSKLATESIQDMIARLGASKVLIRDLSTAAHSFGYLNIKDDNGMPFFVVAKDEVCLPSAADPARCSREIKLTIPSGKLRSEPFFLIVTKGRPEEKLRFNVSPRKMFSAAPSASYMMLNRFHADPDKTLTKSVNRLESPWVANRLLMLTSEVDFFDCYSKTHTFANTLSCLTTCALPGTCDHATRRPFKMIGVVNEDTRDMKFVDIKDRSDAFKIQYRVCRTNSCDGAATTEEVLTTTQAFFERLPYFPGLDNNAYLTPVEVIRYHLERPSLTADPTKTLLMRSTAEIVGSKISFTRAHILSSAIQSIVFFRENISNPAIEFKMVAAKAVQK